MDNAADALKMAFGIFIFITALSILFITTSTVRKTSDVMFFYTDKTNFYEHTNSKDTNREVGYADVVSTLYRYYNETLAVKVLLKNGASYKEYNFDIDYEDIEGDPSDWNGTKPTKLNTIEEREKNLGLFITKKLHGHEGSTFEEEFVEVPTSGIYITAVDGSEITLSQGGKKVYITYKEK